MPAPQTYTVFPRGVCAGMADQSNSAPAALLLITKWKRETSANASPFPVKAEVCCFAYYFCRNLRIDARRLGLQRILSASEGPAE
ncbi:MAG: hypothetical protein Kow00107_04580 [Planctomycetota bacterium]